MLDVAIGIVIGAAFSTIVKSLVDDIIMPIVGMITGGVDFSNLFIVLGDGKFDTLAQAKEAGVATINYGLFINVIVAFLIVAWILFLVVKGANKMNKDEPEPEPHEKDCSKCMSKVNVKASRCAFCTSELL